MKMYGSLFLLFKSSMTKEIELKMLIAGSSPSSPTIEDRMKSLTVDVVSPGANGGSRIGDSGYRSCAGGQHDTFLSTTVSAPANIAPASMLMASEYRSSTIVEAQLMPHLLQGTLQQLLIASFYCGIQ
jgi:hypothetical protein